MLIIRTTKRMNGVICVCLIDVGFELGGQSDVRFLVIQIHYKFASYTGRLLKLY